MYQYDQTKSPAWQQMGPDIPGGDIDYEFRGEIVSMSGDGTKVVSIGGAFSAAAVKVHERSGASQEWTAMPGFPPAEQYTYMYAVAMSSDGMRVALVKNAGNGIIGLFVYELGSGGTWSQVTTYHGLSSSSPGYAVALSANGIRVVVGIPGQGVVQVYDLKSPANVWEQVGETMSGGSRFGTSVAISGDTLVVGSHVKASQTGGAYVFTRNNAGDLSSDWTERAILEASDGAVGDRFGNSVAIDGDTIVIGAHKDHNPDRDSGSAYIFTRDDPGSLTSAWTESKLKPDDGAADDLFGNGVSIEGDVVVIGAYGDDNSKGSNSGAVYVFWRDSTDPSGWTQVAKLIANDGAQNANLGYVVAISGDTLVAGSLALNGGSACVFTKFVYCDASAAPANGAVGDCTSRLAAGTTCQPTCDEGYLVSGPSACDAEGNKTSAMCRELTCCERTLVKHGFGVAYS